MGTPAERLPRRRQTPRQQGLIEPLRLTQGITRGELATILREAALNAEQMIRGNLSRSPTLAAAMRGIDELSNALWNGVHQQIQNGVRSAADLAADHQLARELQMAMPEGILQELEPNLRFNALQSANDLLSRHTNGFTLSQRIYRNGRATVLQVGRIIDQGLALQLSARELAARVRAHFHPRVPGGTSYAANRLARTEINNAHHETTIRVSKERPWVTGYKWQLSGSHPRPDICDTYAHEGDGQHGEGVFSKQNVPSKPHPQCLCFVTVVQEEDAEFQRKLLGGEYDSYLSKEGVRVNG